MSKKEEIIFAKSRQYLSAVDRLKGNMKRSQSCKIRKVKFYRILIIYYPADTL